MLKTHEKFHSSDGKRQILIAEDEAINREMLGHILEDEYSILYACDGAEAMEAIVNNKDTLSLILLDVVMPVMTGLEVLKKVREDKELSHLPIIVTTAETETEVESLNMGAIDFVPKPYPAVSVIKARVLHAIELSEDRDIIQLTERDELTGLYNREYFYRYAEQYDQYHKDLAMDAIIVDINHFHMINERYGRAYGDEVLRRIGQQLRDMVSYSEGIVCRRDADTYMVYCPHREDYQQILDKASIYLSDENAVENRIHLRMGVYQNVDKGIDIERRFDWAKLASDRVRGSFTQAVGIYDDNLRKRQVYAEQLIEDFPTAIAEGQFQVYYQPKFDVRPNTPVLSSAEALVRWVHPELGMISPGVFIPLFEDNGLIQKLDLYVWNETARQISEWKEKFGYAIPISVNVSRVDMYDPRLAGVLQTVVEEHGISVESILLEITESAYTQDSEQIIETVMNLREMGFFIEMDDFGTGYSSLNMISRLPIDAMKLDMQFVRDAFKQGGNTHMLELIIDLSKFLSVPVIAEGVETEDQLHALRNLGCDIVQGYFFSKPVPASEFEPFILQKKEAEYIQEEKQPHEQVRLGLETKEPEDSDEETKDKTPADSDRGREHTGLQLKTASVFFVVIALIASIALLVADLSVTKGYQRMEEASDNYIEAQMATSDMESASDYLTDRVRCFVVTGEAKYVEDFYEEVNTNKRRDNAVKTLETLMGETDTDATGSLNKALTLSNELVGIENYAMRLRVEAGNYSNEEIPAELRELPIRPEDKNLTSAQMRAKAQSLVFDNNYVHYKDRIRENVGICTQALIQAASEELSESSAKLSTLVHIQTALNFLFMLIVLGIVLLITLTIRKPLTEMVKSMQKQEEIEPKGMEELRFVTRTYNEILRENKEARDRLSHEASHDALTGLFNRGAYDLLMESTDTEHMALILVDVDYFKQVNDKYGHAVGDRVLKRVADILRSSFRSVDILCRIGGDEFAVVMTRVNSSMKQLVINKIAGANELLKHPKDDLPPVSLSVGVAFSDRENPQGDIFKDADTALYKVKKAGRNGCEVY